MRTVPGVLMDREVQGGWPGLSRRKPVEAVREVPSRDRTGPRLEKDREAAVSQMDCRGLGPVESYLRHLLFI